MTSQLVNLPGEVAARFATPATDAVKVGERPLRDRGELLGVERGEVG